MVLVLSFDFQNDPSKLKAIQINNLIVTLSLRLPGVYMGASKYQTYAELAHVLGRAAPLRSSRALLLVRIQVFFFY